MSKDFEDIALPNVIMANFDAARTAEVGYLVDITDSPEFDHPHSIKIRNNKKMQDIFGSKENKIKQLERELDEIILKRTSNLYRRNYDDLMLSIIANEYQKDIEEYFIFQTGYLELREKIDEAKLETEALRQEYQNLKKQLQKK